jgi:hypothetical protein
MVRPSGYALYANRTELGCDQLVEQPVESLESRVRVVLARRGGQMDV